LVTFKDSAPSRTAVGHEMHCAVGIGKLGVFGAWHHRAVANIGTFIAPLPISQSIHCAVANIAEHSLSCCLEKNNILGFKSTCDVGNSFQICS
jgi:hypothetical protein